MTILNQMPKIIVIVGPTASGKSDLAVKLAKKFNGEIISADSRQVYRGMDLGTGKITKKEMAGIKHYLLDIASPSKQFSVARYKKLALKAIKKIQKENKIPIICGGTGFYIQAVVDDLSVPPVKPDLKLRTQLEKSTAKELYSRLKKLDPKRAQNIDACNKRRLIRALEIVIKTGQPVPEKQTRQSFNALFLGIKKSPRKLNRLIKTRLKKRLKKGMIAEVKKLRRQGLSWKKLENFGLEYRWLARYLQKKITYQVMVLGLQKDIEHYAKRQMVWFKKDSRIFWIKNFKEASKLVKNFL